MDNQQFDTKINELSSQADALTSTTDMSKLRLDYEQWYTQVQRLVNDCIPERIQELKAAYADISRYLLDHLNDLGVTSRLTFLTRLQQQKGILLSARSLAPTKSATGSLTDLSSPQATIEHTFNRIHLVARQLCQRHEGRSTLIVNDEYDVQDLLHALLRLFFDDIRPEEWTPSYAGRGSRIDFLLKNEQTVIEVKKTRRGLVEKEIGEQLIIDIERYRKHPSCKTLLCLVYDPEEFIANPQGLERDLERQDENFRVKVTVVPRRG